MVPRVLVEDPYNNVLTYVWLYFVDGVNALCTDPYLPPLSVYHVVWINVVDSPLGTLLAEGHTSAPHVADLGLPALRSCALGTLNAHLTL